MTRFLVHLAVALVISAPSGQGWAENVDPSNDDSGQYAWAENAGWINAEPLGDAGPGVQIDDFALSGWMWGENTGWISLSCENTASCAAVDYGVVNDGHGVLAGYAWSENAGWIDFGSAEGDARIDAEQGDLLGYAWAENLGWISLSCANTGSCAKSDYGLRTEWCADTGGPPASADNLFASPAGPDVQLSWAAAPDASWYEVVQGDLSGLRQTAGDFAATTDGCGADNTTALSATVAGTPLMPGEGHWYLVRPVNCRGKGTYDSGAAQQAGLRDVEIDASSNDCS